MSEMKCTEVIAHNIEVYTAEVSKVGVFGKNNETQSTRSQCMAGRNLCGRSFDQPVTHHIPMKPNGVVGVSLSVTQDDDVCNPGGARERPLFPECFPG